MLLRIINMFWYEMLLKIINMFWYEKSKDQNLSGKLFLKILRKQLRRIISKCVGEVKDIY